MFSGSPSRLSLHDLLVVSSSVAKSPESTCFYFSDGLTQSFIYNIEITNNGDDSTKLGSGIVIQGVTDTVEITSVVMWEIKGTGIRIGYGSEVRIIGLSALLLANL